MVNHKSPALAGVMCRTDGRAGLTNVEELALLARRSIEMTLILQGTTGSKHDCIFAMRGLQGRVLPLWMRRGGWTIHKEASSLIHGYTHPSGTDVEKLWLARVDWLRIHWLGTHLGCIDSDKYCLSTADQLATVARQMIEQAVVGDGWADCMYDRIFGRNRFKDNCAVPVTMQSDIWQIYQNSSDVIHGNSHLSGHLWGDCWLQEIAWIKENTPWIDWYPRRVAAVVSQRAVTTEYQI